MVNIILRIEHAGEQPHPSMESVGDPRDGIWVKDDDVLPDGQHMVFPWLKEAIALAAEIKGHGNTCIYVLAVEGVRSDWNLPC